jgi:hypothetical protein
MYAIIIALASIACMLGLWLFAWALWRLPLAGHARVPATTPLAAVVPHDAMPRAAASQSHPVVAPERPPQPAQRDYAQDKAKTAFFERRAKPADLRGGGTEAISAFTPVPANRPAPAPGGLKRRPPPPPPPRYKQP